MNHMTRIGTGLHELVADEATLDLALQGADIAPLLMVLVHLTGERQWLQEVGQHIHGPWNFQEKVPDALKQRVRERLKAVLRELAASDTPLPTEPPAELLREMLSAGVGGTVPEEARADDPRGDEPRRQRPENRALAVLGLTRMCWRRSAP